MTDTGARIRRWSVLFETRLKETLEKAAQAPDLLQQAMAYSLLSGGKRIRPKLVYAACDALAIEPRQLNGVACAIEIIHSYSLIHDDLPAMDDDELRRGRPTCHVAFDEATAILAGDAMQALAFEVLATDPALAVRPSAQMDIIRSIAKACGATGMAGGQALDLSAVGEQRSDRELSEMHRLKTGALIKVSATSPALFAGATAELHGRLERYGDCVGLAFQIHDDILDVTGNVEQTGKSTQKDARHSKPTFPGVLGLEESSRRALELRDRAKAELEGFPGDCGALRWLADFSVKRRN
jgi:farnesyl diphosphate synthase